MKKSLLAILVAAIVVLAVPVLAFAVDNSSAKADIVITGPDGKEVAVDIAVEGTEDGMELQAAQVEAPSAAYEQMATGNEDYVVTFEVNAVDAAGNIVNDKVTTVTIVYQLDADYAGYTAIAYVTHSDGTNEKIELDEVAADGTVQLPMSKLSTITLTLTKPATPTPAPSAGTDTGSSSPKTGGIL